MKIIIICAWLGYDKDSKGDLSNLSLEDQGAGGSKRDPRSRGIVTESVKQSLYPG